MAQNMATTGAIWLRNWDGDTGSQSKLANFPFEGEKLFGSALELLLVESKDKRKVLPSAKKDPPKVKKSSFWPFKSPFSPPPSYVPIDQHQNSTQILRS